MPCRHRRSELAGRLPSEPPAWRGIVRSLGIALALGIAVPAQAQSPEPIHYKFTTGVYRFTQEGRPAHEALDLNLRATAAWGNAWLAAYRYPDEAITQWRVGWDHTSDWRGLRWTPSVQWASGGFLGGSLYGEIGDPWVLGLGLGRTNLRDYFNLNFDPNDAWTLAGGWRPGPDTSVLLQWIRDNREHPDQRHLHLIVRTQVGDGFRLTLDLLDKRGLVEGQPIHRLGFSTGLDWGPHGVRLAWDPRTNFSTKDVLRLSMALRF